MHIYHNTSRTKKWRANDFIIVIENWGYEESPIVDKLLEKHSIISCFG